MLAAPRGDRPGDASAPARDRPGDAPPPRKRARRNAAAPARDLVHWFVNCLGRGHLSCTSIADAAAGAVLAWASDPTRTLERLSRLRRADAEAGLLTTLDEQALQLDVTVDLELCWTPVPYRKRDDHTTECLLHPMYLPHELLHAVANAGMVSPVLLPDRPVRSGAFSHESLKTFWDGVSSCDWFRRHPCREYDMSTMVPVGLHGDDVAITKQDTMLAMSLSGVLGTAGTMESRLAITCFYLRHVAQGSLDAIYRVVAWSMHFCLLGIFPYCDVNGRPWPRGSSRARKAGQRLAGPYRFAYTEIRGDMKFFKETSTLSGIVIRGLGSFANAATRAKLFIYVIVQACPAR